MGSNSSSRRGGRGATEVRGRIFDAIADTERRIAQLHARQAQLIDAARRLGEDATPDERSIPGFDSRSHGWHARVVARRELTSELACTLRVSERAAETAVARSRTLVHQLPAVFAALAEGRIGVRQAHTVVESAWALPDDALPAFELAILPAAEVMTVSKLDSRARVIRERIHPESLTIRATTARECREVLFHPARDGLAWLNSYLPAKTALAAFNRVTRIAQSLREPAALGSHDPRTLAQVRADVLGDLLLSGVTHPDVTDPDEGSASPEKRQDSHVVRAMVTDIEELTGETISIDELAHLTDGPSAASRRQTALNTVPTGTGRGIRAEVHVTVPVLTLLGIGDEPASLEGYGPIDPDTARRLAADAPSFHRILTHPETGAVLSVGRDSYQVPADLRRWLRVRDGTCRHPGCNRTAARCEIDHTCDWQYDGLTEHRNLAHLCSGHHHLKHHTSWSVTQRPDGILDWISPTGRPYSTQPELVMGRSPTFQ